MPSGKKPTVISNPDVPVRPLPPTFTDVELRAIRIMCQGSIPTPIYREVIAVCQRIDKHLGWKLGDPPRKYEKEAEAEYRSRNPDPDKAG